jgi:phosphoribosylamine--glycine ligase
MNVLVTGSGGREHTLVWKLSQSPEVTKIFCAPGNAGIAQLAECVPIGAEDLEGLLGFAKENAIDLTLVGPEAPLVDGIVDLFQENGLRVFGPTGKAAQLEGSKSFAKDIMKRYNIPTAEYEVFQEYDEAVAYVEEKGAPIVVKADGLAAGKGAIVCRDLDSAKDALKEILVDRVFKDAGDQVVVEEFLVGEEASLLAFTDSNTIIPMASSQDHKPAYDNDEGPNTGGMGAYSPAPVVTKEMEQRIYEEVLEPTVRAMREEGIPYKGILYAGLMITSAGPKVVEFNCRFGDPEIQAVMPRMKTDLVSVANACIDGTLDSVSLEWYGGAAVCVVQASGGYPKAYEKGYVITGLDSFEEDPEVIVFHAGTKKADNGDIVTAGGRVLGITGLGPDIPAAIEKAYSAIDKVHFDAVHYRKDIGAKALKHI